GVQTCALPILDKSKLRQSKPVSGTPPKYLTEERDKVRATHDIRKLREMSGVTKSNAKLPEEFNGLKEGNLIMHERFGKGKILNLEGAGADRKAEILFEVGGIK